MMPSLQTVRGAVESRLEWRRFERGLGVEQRAGLERLGSEYGGYVVPVGLVDPSWVCYSCGLGEDASFDLALIERFGCVVHSFDPTPRAAEYGAEVARRHEKFRFFAYGVAGRDETRLFHAPRDPAHVSHSFDDLQGGGASFEATCRSLPSLQAELGHTRLDLLKLDIEGAEYEVFGSMLAHGLRPQVICVEFHKVSSFDEMLDGARALIAEGYHAVHHDKLVVSFVSSAASG